jgi:hypothetical protein
VSGLFEYRAVTILDIRRDNDDHGHIAAGDGPDAAEMELWLNRMAGEGYEVISVGYDANGEPATVVVGRRDGS